MRATVRGRSSAETGKSPRETRAEDEPYWLILIPYEVELILRMSPDCEVGCGQCVEGVRG